MGKEVSKKAVIVEDNLILSVLYQNYLVQKVFQNVGVIREGEKAVDLVKEFNPDVIIMDILLDGDLDGIDAAMRIREFSSVPIIFVTGNSHHPYPQRAQKVTNSKFMVKPISQEKLSGAVDEMLSEVA